MLNCWWLLRSVVSHWMKSLHRSNQRASGEPHRQELPESVEYSSVKDPFERPAPGVELTRRKGHLCPPHWYPVLHPTCLQFDTRSLAFHPMHGDQNDWHDRPARAPVIVSVPVLTSIPSVLPQFHLISHALTQSQTWVRSSDEAGTNSPRMVPSPLQMISLQTSWVSRQMSF